MTALELLERQIRRELARFVEAVHAIPLDKLDWQPAPGARSALNLLQEVAIINDLVPDLYTTKKLDFTPEMGVEMGRRMSEHTDVATLIRMVEEATEREIGRVRGVPEEDYDLAVEMPWFNDYKILDLMNYHLWNMSYHEGQLVYIASLLGTENGSAA